MIEVTDAAKQQLSQVTLERGLGLGRFLRLAVPPAWEGEGDFGIVIDEMGAMDSSIVHEGQTVLLMGPDVAERIPNSLFDYRLDPPGPRFTLDVF